MTQHKSGALLGILCVLLLGVPASAQNIPEEREERPVEEIREELTPAEIEARRKALVGRWSRYIKVTYGYDTNALLNPVRERDDFETFRLGIDYRKTLAERHQLNLSFNAKTQNYNEQTDVSNSLANLRTDYKFAISKKYILGLGHDISLLYYPKNASSEYMFNKVFASFQHRLSSQFFQKLQYEFGIKHYDEALALRRSLNDFQDNRRRDYREGPSYSIGYTFTDRLSSNLTFRYYENDSNAEIQNYYDYTTYEAAPRFSYRINDALSASLSYSFKYKRYRDRHAAGTTDEQVDKIHFGDVGLDYKLNKRHSFTLTYSYYQTASNNASSRYSGSTYEAGWRFDF